MARSLNFPFMFACYFEFAILCLRACTCETSAFKTAERQNNKKTFVFASALSGDSLSQSLGGEAHLPVDGTSSQAAPSLYELV